MPEREPVRSAHPVRAGRHTGVTAPESADALATNVEASLPLLAAVILTKNEQHNITECLQSVSWADRLYVLDSGSTDRTVELARQAGADVQQHPFTNYADQRDTALQMFAAQWILFVDADERATAELGAEVRRVIQEETAVGWWVPRRNYIWGRWIRHTGWYPDYQLRLLKRGFARYDPTREVHEIVQLDGPEGHLRNPLTHYNYATLGQFLHRQNFYSTYEAGVLVKQGIHPKPHSVVVQPLREFRRRYITLQGYKDGGHGLLLSLLMAYYTGVAYRRARRLCQEAETVDPAYPANPAESTGRSSGNAGRSTGDAGRSPADSAGWSADSDAKREA
jgi:(heptosyl)LPS beta-1,4-glucosyltransferase